MRKMISMGLRYAKILLKEWFRGIKKFSLKLFTTQGVDN